MKTTLTIDVKLSRGMPSRTGTYDLPHYKAWRPEALDDAAYQATASPIIENVNHATAIYRASKGAA